MATAKRRAIDHFCRRERLDRRRAGISYSSAVGLRRLSVAKRWVRTRCRRRSRPATRGRSPQSQTDWVRIAALYEALAQPTPSPVVELNRAVAVSMAFGPAAGLSLVDELTSEPSFAGYHLLPSVRGDLLGKLGRCNEARAEFERAASLTRNARERALILERAAECSRSS